MAAETGTDISRSKCCSMDLFEWLNHQWGPGRRFASPRQLSLAISEGHEQNAVTNLENRGLTTIRNVERIARATGTSQLRVLLLAGVVTEEEIRELGGIAPNAGVLSIEEEEWVQMLRQAPPILRESILQGLRAGLGTIQDSAGDSQAVADSEETVEERRTQ